MTAARAAERFTPRLCVGDEPALSPQDAPIGL
jgi:hypothetical protein